MPQYLGCSQTAVQCIYLYTFIIKSGSRSCWLAKQEAWSLLCGRKTCLVVSYWSQWRTGAVECGQVWTAGVCSQPGRAACIQGEHGCLSGTGGWSPSWGHRPSRIALPQAAAASAPPGRRFSTGPAVVDPASKQTNISRCVGCHLRSSNVNGITCSLRKESSSFHTCLIFFSNIIIILSWIKTLWTKVRRSIKVK